MAERDSIRARMKPSRWGSHTAVHASVTSLIPVQRPVCGMEMIEIVTFLKIECFLQVDWMERIETLAVLAVAGSCRKHTS